MTISRDAHLTVLPLLFEDPHSYAMSYDLERLGSGLVVGDLDTPEDREREVFHLEFTSPELPIYPISWPYDILRKTLAYYYSGGQLRVYRMYPANLDEWSVDNEVGFSDIVEYDTGDVEWPWYNQGMTRFNFSMTGVSV